MAVIAIVGAGWVFGRELEPPPVKPHRAGPVTLIGRKEEDWEGERWRVETTRIGLENDYVEYKISSSSQTSLPAFVERPGTSLPSII